MNEQKRLAMRDVAQRAVQTAHVALSCGFVSPALQDRIRRDIGFFTELDALLEGCAALDERLREAVTNKAGEKLVSWIAEGGCSWLRFGHDGAGGLH